MEIPATGAREGDEIDVYVEALFNAKSLEGGRLVPSMLRLPLPDAADLMPLAMGEGAVIVDGGNPRAGIIRQGGQVLADYDFRANPIAADGTITLVLRNEYAGYAVASTLAQAINDEFVPDGYPEIAWVEDAKNIRILIPEPERVNPANFIASIQTIQIDPALITTPARVVVNERIGSIVIMGNVEVSPVAITHDGLSITFITPPPVPTPADPVYDTTQWAKIETTRPGSRDSARLDQLIAAFDQLNIPAADRIAIIHQLKRAGALHAEIIRE
jgi:flagellar P-ring protein precursor FlgI